MIRLALYQPDMPGNVGTILRLAACLGVPVDVIEPCGFPFSERRLHRAGLDYVSHADLTLHPDWNAFRAARSNRLILLTTKATLAYTEATFTPQDILLLGQEGAGVPPQIHGQADLRIRVPMRAGLRSLNVAVAAAMILGEALRQTGGFAHDA